MKRSRGFSEKLYSRSSFVVDGEKEASEKKEALLLSLLPSEKERESSMSIFASELQREKTFYQLLPYSECSSEKAEDAFSSSIFSPLDMGSIEAPPRMDVFLKFVNSSYAIRSRNRIRKEGRRWKQQVVRLFPGKRANGRARAPKREKTQERKKFPPFFLSSLCKKGAFSSSSFCIHPSSFSTFQRR